MGSIYFGQLGRLWIAATYEIFLLTSTPGNLKDDVDIMHHSYNPTNRFNPYKIP